MELFTYQIDPHENPASKNPLSDIDRAVGELRPIVSIFDGFWFFSRLSCLNRPADVEKKNTYGSAGSNSSSTDWMISSWSITFG